MPNGSDITKLSASAVLDTGTFIDSDPTRISWTRALKQDLMKNKALEFAEGEVLISTYRPFSKAVAILRKTAE